MIPITDVTCVMKSYGNHDFTRASVWALRRYYPKLRVIFADGHPTDPIYSDWSSVKRLPKTDMVWIPGAACEDCQNAAMALVDTPYVLLMDNDVKVIGKDAIPLCLEAFEKWPRLTAASGWYGLVVTNRRKRSAFVGTQYTDYMSLSATQAAFSIHQVRAYREVGGMPKEPFWDVPKRLWKGVKRTAGFGGDLTICKRYEDAGYLIVSPRKAVPVIHWGQAVEWMPRSKGKSAFDRWWFSHVKHTRCNPLNTWKNHA